ASIARTIVVDLKGGGDFKSIQQATTISGRRFTSLLASTLKLEKQLSDDELKKFIDILYIDGEGWLDGQPPLD
ncbi:hypothetical protein B296_00041631, partial [Ensete ventricosum]